MTEKTEQKTEFFVVKKAREIAEDITAKAKDYNEKYVKKTLEKGKELGESLKKDSLDTWNKTVENAKKFMPQEIPMVKTVGKKVGEAFDLVTEKVNMPSRKDIEKLSSAMEMLNTKVDRLNEKYSA